MTEKSEYTVTFYSPGTFVAETTTLPISFWDVREAIKLAETVVERHGATPYSFRFRAMNKPDSPLYHLGGTILTLEQIEARGRKRDSILISNMRVNNIVKVVENTNSWLSVHPFADGDVLVNYTPKKKESETTEKS